MEVAFLENNSFSRYARNLAPLSRIDKERKNMKNFFSIGCLESDRLHLIKVAILEKV
jgi:hypothetical protein